MSSQSLDPNMHNRGGGLFHKFISKVSPAASPGNSDCEGSDSHTPVKPKIHRKSFRKRKQQQQQQQQPQQQSSPMKDNNEEETVLKDRANTMPDSKTVKKQQSKSLFKPVPFISVSNERGKETLPKNYQTLTLDRKKHKKIKQDSKSKSKDDTCVP